MHSANNGVKLCKLKLSTQRMKRKISQLENYISHMFTLCTTNEKLLLQANCTSTCTVVMVRKKKRTEIIRPNLLIRMQSVVPLHDSYTYT